MAGSEPAAGGLVGGLATEDELGELLFSLVVAARTRDFDAERALRGAVRRYQASHRPANADSPPAGS
jgi:XTP/dITP diphosphohydrolase